MSFVDKVYEVSKQIPKGSVATYAQIAALSGNPKAARAVGMAMRKNPHMPIVPCHRVVSSSGELTGYSAGGVGVKKEMLLKEGVKFVGDKVDLAKSQWRNIAS